MIHGASCGQWHRGRKCQPCITEKSCETEWLVTFAKHLAWYLEWFELKRQTWYFHGWLSCISTHRNPDVRQSPINLVSAGKRLRSMPLPQSTRHNPCNNIPYYPKKTNLKLMIVDLKLQDKDKLIWPDLAKVHFWWWMKLLSILPLHIKERSSDAHVSLE